MRRRRRERRERNDQCAEKSHLTQSQEVLGTVSLSRKYVQSWPKKEITELKLT